MIRSFADAETRMVFEGKHTRTPPLNIQKTALRKLLQLNNAKSLQVLQMVPGNRLELLKGDRAGQYSIRVNDQWRVCFTWTDEGAKQVEIVDYH